jgi:hypothetical protein
MANPLSVRWRPSGRAETISFDRDEVAVISTVAAAPGTPLEGELDVPGGEPLPIIVKVRRCRREPNGFRIDGRLVNPTRALREALGPGAAGEGTLAAGEGAGTSGRGDEASGAVAASDEASGGGQGV